MANNDSNHSFVTHQGQTQSSFDSLRGELLKLSTLVSEFAVAMGLQTTDALVTSSSPIVASAQFRSPATTASSLSDTGAAAWCSASSGSSRFGTSSTSNVATQMFGEMPTPLSGYDYCSEHHNTTVSTCVPDSNNNLNEQNLDGIPQAYEQSICDLEKLNGGENLSFAKQDKEQLLKCLSKAFAFRNVPDAYIRRTSQEEFQGDENFLWEKSVCRTATGHSISFFPWNPGALLPLMSSKAQHSSQALQPTIDATILAGSSVTRSSECKWLPFWVQNSMNVLWKSETGMTIYISWDPGILNTMYMLLDKYTVPNLMDLKHFWAPLLLQYHSWCTIRNAFLQDQYCCLPTVLDCLYSEPVKQLVCYSSMFSSTAMCMSNPTTVRMRLVLKSGKIAQEEKDGKLSSDLGNGYSLHYISTSLTW